MLRRAVVVCRWGSCGGRWPSLWALKSWQALCGTRVKREFGRSCEEKKQERMHHPSRQQDDVMTMMMMCRAQGWLADHRVSLSRLSFLSPKELFGAQTVAPSRPCVRSTCRNKRCGMDDCVANKTNRGRRVTARMDVGQPHILLGSRLQHRIMLGQKPGITKKLCNTAIICTESLLDASSSPRTRAPLELILARQTCRFRC